ncbi:hypothetical protein C8R42DRAFT_728120 [Lentinula raphanica]|nr:hypothetical protein C8R42DRAFT_728120 [Lentinula raphanica]
MAMQESSAQKHPDFGGLAVVVDSSVALAGNWFIILKYLGLFVQKLIQTNHGTSIRIAWVTYGPPDSVPSSLLSKRYFAEIIEITSLLKVTDELHQLGIGTTHCGGTRGMAMLEGLVAAIELFDTLNETSRRSSSHILHITASFPDNAKHPLANMSPSLDNITWETLPDELSKRNIHLNSIILNPRINTKIPELHSSPSLNTSPASWLPVDPPHVAYVASLGLIQKGVKRPADQMTVGEQPPEKRQQLNVPSASPPRNKPNVNVNINPPITANKPPNSGPSTQQSQPQPTLPPNAPDHPNSTQPSQVVPPLSFTNLPPLNSAQKVPWPGNVGNLTPAELINRCRQFEELRRRLDVALAQATTNGDTTKIESTKQQIAQLEPTLMKLRLLTTHYLNAVRRAGIAAAPPNGPAPPSGPSVPPAQNQSLMSTDSTGNSNTTNSSAPNANNLTMGSQPPTTQLLPPLPSSNITSSPAMKPNENMMPPASSVKIEPSSSPLAPSTSNTSTKPSPKPSAVKPSPKVKPKTSPMKNHSTIPPSSSTSTNTSTSESTNGPGSGPGPSPLSVPVPIPVPNPTPGLPMPSNLPPDTALQMQKLIEQGGRGHPRDMAMGSMGQQASPNMTPAGVGVGAGVGVPPPQQMMPGQGMQGMVPGQGQPGPPSLQGGGIVAGRAGAMVGGPAGMNMPNPAAGVGPQGQARNGGIPAWTGTFFYAGEQNGTRKEIRISIMAMSLNHLECRAHTWPSEMILAHSRDPVVSASEFQMWAKKTRPVNNINEQLFNGIHTLVRGSKTYIVSSWTLPSGGQTNNVLFADVTPHGLIGAFFPVTGIPEMPKHIAGLPMVPQIGPSGGMGSAGGGGGGGPGTGPGPIPNQPNIYAILQSLNMPPEIINKILQMPPEGRMQAVKSIVTKHAAFRNQMQAQGVGGGGGGGGGPAQMGGAPKPGGSNVNITAAAAAMAMRMKQPGGMGLSPGLQNIGVHGGMQGGAASPSLNMPVGGMQRQVSGQDGIKPGQPSGANMAALLSGMRGNMGGMGGLNAANSGNNMPNLQGMGGPGGGNLLLQQQMAQMQQMQQMQQTRAALGGGGMNGAGGPSAGNQKLSMDMFQSFLNRNGQEGKGGPGGQPG